MSIVCVRAHVHSLLSTCACVPIHTHYYLAFLAPAQVAAWTWSTPSTRAWVLRPKWRHHLRADEIAPAPASDDQSPLPLPLPLPLPPAANRPVTTAVKAQVRATMNARYQLKLDLKFDARTRRKPALVTPEPDHRSRSAAEAAAGANHRRRSRSRRQRHQIQQSEHRHRPCRRPDRFRGSRVRSMRKSGRTSVRSS